MTSEELLEIGMCCGLECQHCPYTPPYVKGNKSITQLPNEGMKENITTTTNIIPANRNRVL